MRGNYEQYNEHCDYDNYCGEAKAALRKQTNQVSKSLPEQRTPEGFFVAADFAKCSDRALRLPRPTPAFLQKQDRGLAMVIDDV